MRRLILEEPVTRPARWSSRLALFAAAATGIAVLLVRGQRVEPNTGLVAVAAGLLLALAALGLAVLAFVRIWQEGRRGLGSAIRGAVLGLAILAYPGWLAGQALILPPLPDLSTDTDNPPAFSRSRAALDARGGRMPPEPDEGTRVLQRASYPDLGPLLLEETPEEAFEFARKAALARGFEIVETVRPGGRVGIGRIEAVARTLVLRLPADLTVRIRPRASGTRIDVRCAARAGRDFGELAGRIRAYLDEITGLAGGGR